MKAHRAHDPTDIVPVLQVHPTRRCNLACAHCYSSSGPFARQTLGIDLLSACLEDAALLGYQQLAVSGGEPLLYPELRELLAHARELDMMTVVTTNGMLATAERWDELAPLVDIAAVSIDGTPSEHDALHRHNGAFTTAIRNLEVIRASGVPFALAFTLGQHNIDSLDFVVRLAAHHGACAVQVHPLTLHGRAATELADARPDSIELAFALLEAARLARELDIAVHVDALSAEQLVIHRSAVVPSCPVADITAVAPVLVVQADATVMPLTQETNPRLALGSLRTARLAELAGDWLFDGHGEALADACARTWTELTAPPMPHAVSWYDEVAMRTWPPAVTMRLLDRDRSLCDQAS